jgi:sensor histidine kinase YesM
MIKEEITRGENFGQHQSLFADFFTGRRFKILRHLLLLGLFVLLVSEDNGEYKVQGNTLYGIQLLALIWFVTFLYLNMYILVPRLLFKGRLPAYLLGATALLGLSFFLVAWADVQLNFYRHIPKKTPENALYSFLKFVLVFGIILAASTCIKLFQRWVKDVERISKLQSLTLKHELHQLKSQINPHFLFNTLNNAHILTKTDPSRASFVLLNLSDLLRYQIYNCGNEKVALRADIGFIEDFLNLEKIRRDLFRFEIGWEGDQTNMMIPPLLFIPFVENAVKHNHDSEKASYVNLKFKLERNRLLFSCINSKPVKKSKAHSMYSGFGLLNIRRRLSLLFPDRHTLFIEELPLTYEVKLELNL